jgi:copper chaperone CopZ
LQEHAFTLPALWADHHVLTVRETLFGVDGIESVVATAADRRARVTFDAGKTSVEAIAAALTEAGYAPGEVEEAADPPTNKPAWATSGMRVTATDPADLAMSGDHRKY